MLENPSTLSATHMLPRCGSDSIPSQQLAEWQVGDFLIDNDFLVHEITLGRFRLLRVEVQDLPGGVN